MLSVFDMFKIGVGPSSSHTVGPMKAARAFARQLSETGVLNRVQGIRIWLHGSLAATGKGHATDTAVLLGLSGYAPDTIDIDAVPSILAKIGKESAICLDGRQTVRFDALQHIKWSVKPLAFHPNGMTLSAFGADGDMLAAETYFSVGGGFVVRESDIGAQDPAPNGPAARFPYDYGTADDLVALCKRNALSIAELMRANERALRTDEEIDRGLVQIWQVMNGCIERGCVTEGLLPGRMQVRRRAPSLAKLLRSRPSVSADPLYAMEWVNLYAMAVNEENAAGGRVVTAPTNGAAGIIPAVLRYYVDFVPEASEHGVMDFLLTAAAIGILYKKNASISGAEVGCQGEVGVACSMAAAGLCAVLGGSIAQVENAAEIGMEHHLGLTCDPVGGMVQIPCIERNAIGSIKAINAARMALFGDGEHHVSLDNVIKTMRDTGADMLSKYKETSEGGLAVNIVEC
ncbi:L-serine ammonia-lyase [Bradyrhizobium jicamae]|uniref:L-serine dehydratase n=1 Tax=Bradyrhizobium jicamae TaxID=280332 RepID=A0ABS5FK93_9BRAD|nr:L-serine ammonia-lyase [Bradyrhizobium jicamae]MBR0797193.1 L-serine ammonia-lyase [Bradyrhizobium jicamae]MBR0934893.1 L-serine ammonia-lyase [Bradyrhizobium jicamae]